ncbi:hypothetical protein RRG08_019588 [Elysia crispata]|uniref:Uncharacterized protein n=1 Tax=Elysia crispata TaxID=231223 RepID=A0AAE0ZFB3_9GAST|nr:hypothetical protein RRG08_019588 [Elysia crispata]
MKATRAAEATGRKSSIPLRKMVASEGIYLFKENHKLDLDYKRISQQFRDLKQAIRYRTASDMRRHRWEKLKLKEAKSCEEIEEFKTQDEGQGNQTKEDMNSVHLQRSKNGLQKLKVLLMNSPGISES